MISDNPHMPDKYCPSCGAIWVPDVTLGDTPSCQCSQQEIGLVSYDCVPKDQLKVRPRITIAARRYMNPIIGGANTNVDVLKLSSNQIKELFDFVADIATGNHEDICPLAHPAYRYKWCDCCEARRLIDRLEADLNKQ